MSIKIYHIRGPYDDPYEYLSLDPMKVKNHQSWENLDIIEVKSIYHFFECFNTEDNIDNMQDIFLTLMEYHVIEDFPAI